MTHGSTRKASLGTVVAGGVRRCGVAAFLVLAGPVPVAPAADDPPRISTSLSIWQSTGGSTWSHDASAVQPLFGDPTSRLEYDGVDSTIVELRARVGLANDFTLELAYGAGDVDEGRLTDADFISARGADAFRTRVRGSHAYSETVSNLNGDSVHYYDVKLGRTLYRSADGETTAAAGVRYLDWTEQYLAHGITQTVCTAPSRLCMPRGATRFNDRNVILNDARWRALFIGMWGTHRLGEGFSLSGELSLSPLADLTSDDRHFLRPDLAQDPSFRLEGQGRAATARIEASYGFSPRLSASLGLRYWWMEVSNETRGFTAFPAASAPFSSKLNSFESERYGVTLSITYALGAVP